MTTTTRATRVRITDDSDARAYLATRGIDVDALTTETKSDGSLVVAEPWVCPRCGGTGWIRAYSHREGGVCFKCYGRNTSGTRRRSLVAYAKAERKRELAELARARKQAAREERMLEGQRRWCEANGYGRITFEERDAQRAAARELARKREVATGRHVGTVGERAVFRATVTKVLTFETTINAWTTRTVWIFLMKTPAGAVLKTKASGYGLANEDGMLPREGDEIVFKGTVKSHGDYRGVPQTELSRCALASVEPAAA